MNVLMLTIRMQQGFGVSEVIGAVVPELAELGVQCHVGAMFADDAFAGIDVRIVDPTPEAVASLAAKVGAGVVVAHGSPFLEVLPALPEGLVTVAWEHGEPTPEFFTDDAVERREIIERIRASVYPKVDHVVAISEFVRHDIGWPTATVIVNGADHVPDLGTKLWVPPRDPGGRLRVGCLVRLGDGEAFYKGRELLVVLQHELNRLGVPADLEVMGRGTPQDAERLEADGFVVHLNATDDERTAFLRGLDVFVSPSKWEGCNLPLVEAEALDTGAHPEFTPLVFANLTLLAAQVQAYGERPELLQAHSDLCYRYVRAGMRWQLTAAALVDLLAGQSGRPMGRASAASGRWRSRVAGLKRVWRREGAAGTARKVWAKVTTPAR